MAEDQVAKLGDMLAEYVIVANKSSESVDVTELICHFLEYVSSACWGLGKEKFPAGPKTEAALSHLEDCVSTITRRLLDGTYQPPLPPFVPLADSS